MTQEIGLGGGCHWCTEAVFGAVPGVTQVSQGFIASDPPDGSLSEAVRLRFEPEVVTLDDLLLVHLKTHASLSDHSMRGKYRSAVYVTRAEQAAAARSALLRLEDAIGGRPVTRVLRLQRFEASPERYRRYYETRPDAPFCRTHIVPKLDLVRTLVSDL